MNSIYQKNNFWAIPVPLFHFLYQKKPQTTIQLKTGPGLKSIEAKVSILQIFMQLAIACVSLLKSRELLATE